MIIILDRGHGQKGRSDPFDPGATRENLREVDLTAAYIRTAAARLTAAGHDVRLITTGHYSARHVEACGLAGDRPGLYVQCHVNAGGGRYGLVEHDARSKAGQRAATALALALTAVPGITGGKVAALASGQRGWVCIDGIWDAPKMCGLIYEPGFIDAPQHAELWTAQGLARIGEALASGIERYAAGGGA